jgi:hypothetical protein
MFLLSRLHSKILALGTVHLRCALRKHLTKIFSTLWQTDVFEYLKSWTFGFVQLKQSAAQWVRYALEQSKRVKFWEFSNESYFKAYNGFATASQVRTPERLSTIVIQHESAHIYITKRAKGPV